MPLPVDVVVPALPTRSLFVFEFDEAHGRYDLINISSSLSWTWRNGCIIRAALLEDIAQAYKEDPQLQHLLLAPAFIAKAQSCVASTRELLSYSITNGISMPGLSASLTYFENFTSRRMPTNMIQAQRDYFGSHTYERTDREGTFHTEWSKI